MDLKKIKLVVLDLDGTLLDGEGRIGKQSLNLIKQLRLKDVEFMIASGRLHSSILPYAKTLELSQYIVSLDGALIKHYPDNKVLHQAHIPASKVQKAIAQSEIQMSRMILCGDDHIYYTDNNEVVKESLDRFGADYKEVSSYYKVADEILEVVFISDNKPKLKDIQKQFEFPRAFGLTTNFSNSLSDKGMYYLEVRKKGSTKAKSVKRVMKKLGISVSELAVTGDWYNDLELFDLGAFTAAPANAVPEIANNASLLTSKPNTEDGISEFFQMMLEQK